MANVNVKADVKKATKLIESTVDAARGEVTFKCGSDSAILYVAALDPKVATQALLHGLRQKIGDAAAKSRDPVTGKPAPIAERWAAVVDMVARLERGEWNAPAGDGSGGASIVILAAMRLFNETRAQSEARFDAIAKKRGMERRAVLAAMRDKPPAKLAPIIAAIEAERAASRPAVDTDAMLDEAAAT